MKCSLEGGEFFLSTTNTHTTSPNPTKSPKILFFEKFRQRLSFSCTKPHPQFPEHCTLSGFGYLLVYFVGNPHFLLENNLLLRKLTLRKQL